jgi:hypothetical protein
LKPGIAVALLLVLLMSCTDEVVSTRGTEYFPLRTGYQWVYHVQETTYGVGGTTETTFKLKIEVTDSFTNTEGGITYVLHRYRRMTDSEPWTFESTASARLSGTFAHTTSGNTTYASLAFPAYVSRTWNGNVFNALGEDEYRVTAIGESMTVEGETFSDVLQVEQERVENNLVFRDVREEVYAKNIGLIYKRSEVWNYVCSGGLCTEQIASGQQWIQSLISHGVQ